MIQSLPQASAHTRRLSAYIAQALDRPLPEDVAAKATQHILDTIAAMISGTQLRPGRLAIAYATGLGGSPQCSIVGTALKTSAVNAALANGMLAHADETDDSHAPSRTHPGCAVIPAALAAAEHVGAGGERFMRAVVLGYDVAARLNYALDPEGFAAASRSTHSFGGTFGAGAAAGALLELTESQIPFILSYCAQQASGLGANVRDSDHIEKAFDFGGMPARNGMTAATMVAAGFTGVDDVFSGERNFFEAYAANANPDALIEGLGTTFEIIGTNIKKWSVGSPAQSALDAMIYLMETERLFPDDIETIAVHLPTRSARTVDSAPMPDVNVQHLLAMLLVDRKLTFKSVHDHARMNDDTILALRRRITIVASEELMYARPRRQAIVEVTTRNGGMFMRRTHAVRGTADNPMSLGEIEAKATDLMTDVIGAAGTKGLIAALRDLSALPDMRMLRNFWQSEAPREAAS